MQKELEKYKEDLEMKKFENEAMKSQVSKLDKDLNKMKKDYKYNDRFFQVERLKDSLVKNKKPMTLLFKLNPENKKDSPKVIVVMNRSRHGHYKTDTVDILGIKLSVNSKKSDQYDIVFNVSYTFINI